MQRVGKLVTRDHVDFIPDVAEVFPLALTRRDRYQKQTANIFFTTPKLPLCATSVEEVRAT
jgi:hypothetical protein